MFFEWSRVCNQKGLKDVPFTKIDLKFTNVPTHAFLMFALSFVHGFTSPLSHPIWLISISFPPGIVPGLSLGSPCPKIDKSRTGYSYQICCYDGISLNSNFNNIFWISGLFLSKYNTIENYVMNNIKNNNII